MSKKRSRRVFGMTTFQLAFLGILSLIAITVIFGGFIYISSATQPQGTTFFPTAEPPNVAQQPEPQSSPILPAEPLGPSDLPPETIFTVNNEPLPDDWVQYSTSRVEIWVPPQFESVFVEPERQKRIVSFRQQGFDFLAADLENNSFDYRFWFNFPQPDTVPYQTSIIMKTDVLSTDTLDEYVDQTYDGLQGFQLIARQDINFEDLEVRRIILTANLGDTSIGVVDYVITDGINLWVIRAGSNLDEFYDWLPQFDRIARSFRLVN